MSWRSVLFVPVLQERFLAKAASRGADAILLDLEASIAASRKAEARAALPAAVDTLAAQDQDVLVRINMLWRPALADLEVAVRSGVKAIQLPNCRSAADVAAADQVMAEIEAEKGLSPLALIPIIESAQGVVAAAEVAAASPRVQALTFGIEDYLADMQSAPDPAILTSAALTVAHAARAAGVAPMVVPGTLADITDLDAFSAAVERGRAMGSVGGYAVHPGQVAVLNRIFSPAPNEVEWAKRVVAAAAEADAAGLGAVNLDGRMIDLPIIVRAERLLERHQNLEGRA